MAIAEVPVTKQRVLVLKVEVVVLVDVVEETKNSRGLRLFDLEKGEILIKRIYIIDTNIAYILPQ